MTRLSTKKRGRDMDRTIRLKHPRGKKAVSMDSGKYALLKPIVLKCLRARGKATFTELAAAVRHEFKASGTTFDGSVPWHLEWVKLDLEARKIIARLPDTSPQQYTVVR